MTSRFASELAPALDTGPLVADAGKQGTATDQPPAPAPPQRAPTWDLRDVAALKNEGSVDPLVLRGSVAVLSVSEGKKLHDELVRIVRKQVRVVVEAFATHREFSDARNRLTGSTEAVDPSVKGHTDPFRVPGDLVFDLDERTNKPKGFNVLVRIPSGRPGADVGMSETDWVETSDPFRRLTMATTLFHELLHVRQMSVAVDYENETSIRTERSGGRLQTFETATSGHFGDVFFSIDSTTLKLVIEETTGTVDRGFGDRVRSFVDQLVVAFDLKAAIAAERAAFRAKAKPGP